jgi:hypothetical protein
MTKEGEEGEGKITLILSGCKEEWEKTNFPLFLH